MTDNIFGGLVDAFEKAMGRPFTSDERAYFNGNVPDKIRSCLANAAFSGDLPPAKKQQKQIDDLAKAIWRLGRAADAVSPGVCERLATITKGISNRRAMLLCANGDKVNSLIDPADRLRPIADATTRWPKDERSKTGPKKSFLVIAITHAMIPVYEHLTREDATAWYSPQIEERYGGFLEVIHAALAIAGPDITIDDALNEVVNRAIEAYRAHLVEIAPNLALDAD